MRMRMSRPEQLGESVVNPAARTSMKTIIAKWQSKSAKEEITLFHDELGFTYRGTDCGGNLGNCLIEQAAEHVAQLARTAFRARMFQLQECSICRDWHINDNRHPCE